MDRTRILSMITIIEKNLSELKSLVAETNMRVIDKRHIAGAEEVSRIATLIQDINTRTPVGLSLIDTFKAHTGKDIVKAEDRSGGNRSTHYDMIFTDTTGETHRIEHKGSDGTKPITNPCDAGVQILNGPGNWFTVCQILSDLYYNNFIANGKLAETFGITSPIPSRTDFYNDQVRQGNPHTPFLKELKKKVRDTYGPRASLKDVPGLDPRPILIPLVQRAITHEQIDALKKEIISRVSPVLNQKDFYLIDQPKSGTPFKMFDGIDYTIKDIRDITVDTTHTDLCFKIQAITHNDTEFPCHLRLRWGKGIGFTNIRADLRID